MAELKLIQAENSKKKMAELKLIQAENRRNNRRSKAINQINWHNDFLKREDLFIVATKFLNQLTKTHFSY